jgi:hypothetical protein
MRRSTAGSHPRPGLPTVNLLSPSAFDRLAARRLRHRFAAGGLVLVTAVGAGWGAQHVRVAEARKVVAVEQAQTHRLSSENQALAPVRAFVSGVAVQERTVQGAMAPEIYFSEVLDGVRAATPSGASLESLSVTLAGPTDQTTGAGGGGGSACPGPDPFDTKTVVGCVTLSGTAASRSEVGTLVISLGDSDLFVEPFISTTTTADAARVTFSGSVGLSRKVYSKRYADPAVPAADTAAGGGS